MLYSNIVLIVAKCIVNELEKVKQGLGGVGINSSKVYCKCQFYQAMQDHKLVLIVAKCIVNRKKGVKMAKKEKY